MNRCRPFQFTWLFVLCLLFTGAGSVSAQFPGTDKPTFFDSRDKVTVSVVPGWTQVKAGSDVPIAVVFDHVPDWHIHLNVIKVDEKTFPFPVETLIPTSIKVSVADGAPVSLNDQHLQWPEIHDHNIGSKTKPIPYKVFEGKAIAYLPVTVKADAKPGTVKIDFTVEFQACGKNDPTEEFETCLAPAEQKFSVTLQVLSEEEMLKVSVPALKTEIFGGFDGSVWADIHAGKTAPNSNPDSSPTDQSAAAAKPLKFSAFGLSFTVDPSSAIGFILMLLVAMVGGLALNFMPCVLPIIPLKIMSLSKAAETRRRSIALGASMALGVLFFWLVLGALVASLTSFDGPSQIFSYPGSNLAIGIFIIAMGIGMLGVFTVGLPKWVYNISPKHDSHKGSFAFGIMTAVMATPCTAPFMGTALGWSVTQPPLVNLSVFAAIGAGMAVPYLVLAAYPKLIEKLPRTGPANELLKHVMGLLMLAAGAYFAGVGIAVLLGTPGEPVSQMYWLPVMLLLAAAGAWLTLGIAHIRQWPVGPIVFAAIGILLFSSAMRKAIDVVFPTDHGGEITQNGASGSSSTDPTHIGWALYTPERLKESLASQQVTVVDFTAEWCINCKVLESTVLHTKSVAGLLREAGVNPIKVDLTVRGGPGWPYLKENGATGPPLLIVYGADGREVFKSNAYTISEVIDAVKKARTQTVAASN